MSNHYCIPESDIVCQLYFTKSFTFQNLKKKIKNHLLGYSGRHLLYHEINVVIPITVQ